MNDKESFPLFNASPNLRRMHSVTPRLKGARILITGASGFVGRNLLFLLDYLNAFHDLKLHIGVFARQTSVLFLSRRYPQVSIFEITTQSQCIKFNPDFVFHCANSNADMSESSFEPAKSVAFSLLKKTLETFQITENSRVVLASSGAVYGQQSLDQAQQFVETSILPIDGQSAYARTKKYCEDWLLNNSSNNFSSVVCRLFTFYGPHLPLDLNFAAGNFFRDTKKERKIRLCSAGLSVRSYLSSYDMAIVLVMIAASDFRHIINVGSGKPISIKDFAKLFLTAAHLDESRLELCNSIDESATYYVPNTGLLEEIIDFEESSNLSRDLSLWLQR